MVFNINADAVQACALALIRTMNEVNELWDGDYSLRQAAVMELIKSGYDIHVEFMNFTRNISAQCDRSDKILESIKTELKIAEEQAEFDGDVTREIQKKADELLNTAMNGENYSNQIQTQIISHQENISNEKEGVIEMGHLKNRRTMEMAITGGTSAGMGLVVAHGAIIATGGGALLVGIAGGACIAAIAALLKARSRNKKVGKMTAVLDRLAVLMTDLYKHSDYFTVALTDLIKELQQFLETAGKNVEYSGSKSRVLGKILAGNSGSKNRVRVKILAGKMITETTKLQQCYQDIKYRADENTDRLRARICETNPQSLLTM